MCIDESPTSDGYYLATGYVADGKSLGVVNGGAPAGAGGRQLWRSRARHGRLALACQRGKQQAREHEAAAK
uniref:Uncharacterized protein n=1 Tax=Tanacetum cinerariifolium TaxID=118510 RepID=A0A699TDD3_TANCI|nr:hypothetical protein [Tanacetum cinerariifolium]